MKQLVNPILQSTGAELNDGKPTWLIMEIAQHEIEINIRLDRGPLHCRSGARSIGSSHATAASKSACQTAAEFSNARQERRRRTQSRRGGRAQVAIQGIRLNRCRQRWQALRGRVAQLPRDGARRTRRPLRATIQGSRQNWRLRIDQDGGRSSEYARPFQTL